jgi:hypothetical protein
MYDGGHSLTDDAIIKLDRSLNQASLIDSKPIAAIIFSI